MQCGNSKTMHILLDLILLDIYKEVVLPKKHATKEEMWQYIYIFFEKELSIFFSAA